MDVNDYSNAHGEWLAVMSAPRVGKHRGAPGGPVDGLQAQAQGAGRRDGSRWVHARAGRGRFEVRRPVKAAVAAVACVAGLAGAGAVGRVSAPSEPAACHVPSLPSGDAISVDQAGNANTPPLRGGVAEFVCTDGTWVRVSGYGN